MNKETEKQVEIVKGRIWSVVLFIVILVIGAGLVFRDHNKRLNGVECASGVTEGCKQPNSLAGWSEECIQNKTIEKHEYIENPKLSNSELIDCGLSCGAGVIEGIDGTKFVDYANNLNPHCITSCMDNKERELKPFVRFWNETVCVKKMLVKEAIE